METCRMIQEGQEIFPELKSPASPGFLVQELRLTDETTDQTTGRTTDRTTGHPTNRDKTCAKSLVIAIRSCLAQIHLDVMILPIVQQRNDTLRLTRPIHPVPNNRTIHRHADHTPGLLADALDVDVIESVAITVVNLV
jgi:hypothetical protein